MENDPDEHQRPERLINGGIIIVRGECGNEDERNDVENEADYSLKGTTCNYIFMQKLNSFASR